MKDPQEKLYKFCPTCKTALEYKFIDGRNRLSCSKCGFILWSNPKPVVSLLVCRADEVLMVQRAKEPLFGYWCLPGGFLEYEESPQEGVIRELKEELGTEVSINKLINIYQIDNDPRGIHLDIIFSGNTEDEIKPNEELSGYKYLDINNLPEKIAYKHREAIRDYFKRHKKRGT